MFYLFLLLSKLSFRRKDAEVIKGKRDYRAMSLYRFSIRPYRPYRGCPYVFKKFLKKGFSYFCLGGRGKTTYRYPPEEPHPESGGGGGYGMGSQNFVVYPCFLGFALIKNKSKLVCRGRL
jgi:hypothetical protein